VHILVIGSIINCTNALVSILSSYPMESDFQTFDA